MYFVIVLVFWSYQWCSGVGYPFPQGPYLDFLLMSIAPEESNSPTPGVDQATKKKEKKGCVCVQKSREPE